MEPAVEVTVRARVRAAPSPWAAHGAEAEVVGDVVGEDAVGDHPRQPVPEMSPVPPLIFRGRHGDGAARGCVDPKLARAAAA